MKIFLVDDDETLRTSLKMRLEAACFSVDTAADGEQGSFMARTNEYDLIVLDGVMPKMTGWEACKAIREAGKTTPILMLSVQSEIQDKVGALNLGADDYLTKPFSFDEFLARVRALLRRPLGIVSEVLQCSDLTLDVHKQRVTRGKEDVRLTRKEFMLLEYLLRHKGGVVSRGDLLEHIWDSSVDVFSNTIESHILSLRKKIDVGKKTKLIYTVSGRGYKIDERN